MIYEVGDEVQVIRYGKKWEGPGRIAQVAGKIYIVSVNGTQGGFQEEDLVPLEIYNSPLEKALR